ncbi:hypothetical protein EON78_06910 [bacterium]|nr:MAG: hypothetical protein EON78_06910 [bacterium]
MNFDWINTIEEISVASISIIENKTPVEIVSDPEIKASLIKMISEMVRVGRFFQVDFPENFINHTLKKASLLNESFDISKSECIEKIGFITTLAEEKKIRVNQNQKILDILKEQNG